MILWKVTPVLGPKRVRKVPPPIMPMPYMMVPLPSERTGQAPVRIKPRIEITATTTAGIPKNIRLRVVER